MSWWRQGFIGKLIPTKNEREVARLIAKVQGTNALDAKMRALPDESLRAKTGELRVRYEQAFKQLGGDPTKTVTEGLKADIKAERKLVDAALETILADAFAVCREAGRRVLNMRHFDVQLMGGMVLHEGKIAEMKTGEGKTLVATLPVYLNAIAGRGVHVVTVNEYLATRDSQWMGQLYRFLGMETGLVVHGLTDAQRKQQYAMPITYGTNSEFGFDYLRDNMKLFLSDYVQRGHHFSIVDEVDSILIDEARTPLIISGPSEESTDKYGRINSAIPSLKREVDYTIDEKSRTVVLTERGIETAEKKLGVDNLYAPDNIEILHHVNQGLRAHTLYRRDVDYMVEDGKVKIIDEFTGRVLDGRRWSDGLHQAVEAKEGVKIENENQTLATITYQNYFRMFMKLGGMTGTAMTEVEEFSKIYDLEVVAVPTNRDMIRDDADDLIFKSEREKFAAISKDIMERQAKGQPILVGTTSVEKSEVLSRELKKLKIPHSVLNAKYHRQEAEIIAQAGRKGAVTIATNMAGRGTDILLGGNPEFLAKAELTAENETELPAMLTKYQAQCEAEKNEVRTAGGLCVIGSERHESRRIDNQLRGRSGRQGDPGSSRFYLSLEDDLMRIFGGERITAIMETLGMKEGEVIQHPLVNRSIENAQRRVEGHNFDIRKHLLEYDDVMNDQRIAVYKLRRRVLSADAAATKELVLDAIEDVIINIVARTCPEKTNVDQWKIDELEIMLKEQFNVDLKLGEIKDVARAIIEETIFTEVEKVLLAKETEYGADSYYGVSRIIYLQTIDQLWKEHLRDMDQLREGISLRGYAQKDPKQEYKKEGYNLFVQMMSIVTADVLQKTFRVVITQETEDEYQSRLERQRDRQRQLMQSRTTSTQALPGQAAPAAANGAPAPAPIEEDDGPSVADKVKRDVSANKKKRDRRRA